MNIESNEIKSSGGIDSSGGVKSSGGIDSVKLSGGNAASNAAEAQAMGNAQRDKRLAREQEQHDAQLERQEKGQPVREIIITPDGAATVQRGRDGKVFIEFKKQKNTSVTASSGTSFTPFMLTGTIDGGVAKITIRPGLVNSAIPTVSGTSIAAYPAPTLTVTGAEGIIELKATVDSTGTVTALIAQNVTTASTDTSTDKYKTVGTWTSASGAFTSVTSILNTNQTLYICGVTAIWEA